MKRVCQLVALFMCIVLAKTALAQEVHGHIKVQGGRTFYHDEASPEDVTQGQLDVRILTEEQQGPFSFDVHAELLALAQTEKGQENDMLSGVFNSFSFIETRESRRLFDMTTALDESANTSSLVRFDRLRIAYQDEQHVLSLGRQALSWGNGLLFQVLDVVNPFSPADVIKAYKSGDDMAYAQHLFAGGDDVQLAIVPRRDIQNGNISEDESTYAVKYKSIFYESGRSVDIFVARHYQDTLLGAGFSQPIEDALLRADLLYTSVPGGDNYLSFLFNLDRSLTIGTRSLYLMLEYFYNDFGVSEDQYTMPTAELVERLQRTELFTIGRHYLGSRAELEVSPLMRCSLSGFLNVGDTSGLLQPGCTYDWSQDIQMIVGGSIPMGASQTEFGGYDIFSTGAQQQVTVEAPSVLYVRVEYYF